jgi:cytochrome c-type biogenesis protein CcmH
MKRFKMNFLLIVFSVFSLVLQVMALNSKQEQDYLALTKELRCVTCQNQSIADSQAPAAQAMKVLVHQKLEQGMSKQEIKDFLEARYGEYVLYQPKYSKNTLLWVSPLVLLFLSILFLVKKLRPTLS